MFKISVCSCGKAIDSIQKILQFANCTPSRVWYNDGILYKGGFSIRRTKALLSCLLALALVMLTACGARQQTVHRLSADRVTQAATVSQLQEVSDLIVVFTPETQENVLSRYSDGNVASGYTRTTGQVLSLIHI